MTLFSRSTLCATFLLLMFALAGSPSANAQGGMLGAEGAAQPVKNQLSLNFSVGIPSGGFSDVVGNNAYGADLSYGRRLFELPLYVGADFGVGIYGAESIEFLGVTFTKTSLLIQPQLSLRFQPGSGAFRPFAEGLVGFNVLATSISAEGEEGNVGSAPGSESSGALGMGVGAGFDYRLFQAQEGGTLGISASVQYIYGGKAEIPQITDQLETTTIEKNTTVLRPELGLYLDF